MDEPDFIAQSNTLHKLLLRIASQDWEYMKGFIDTGLNHDNCSIPIFEPKERAIMGLIGDCVGHLQAIQYLVKNKIGVTKIPIETNY